MGKVNENKLWQVYKSTPENFEIEPLKKVTFIIVVHRGRYLIGT
jgi:hypothetical protein